jgi:DNA-binding CsgD family transcriptional regulator
MTTDDYRLLLDVLDTCQGAGSERQLRERALESIAVAFGYPCVTFFLGAEPSQELGYHDPIALGVPDAVLDRYLDSFAPGDLFGTDRGRDLLQANGVATLDEVSGQRLTMANRAFIEGFLRQSRVSDKLVVWLNTGGAAHGYLTLVAMNGDRFTEIDRARMQALRSHLGFLLGHSLTRSADRRIVAGLSPREEQVARYVIAGLSNQQIATRLDISLDTVKKHVTATLSKCGVRSRTELAVAHHTGVLPGRASTADG